MIRTARSFLFVPADRPERFRKAMDSGAHSVILDLEDAVAPQAKDRSRDNITDFLRTLGASSASPGILVRINAADTPWHAHDLQWLREFAAVGVMLPKAEAVTVRQASEQLPGQALVALVETVRGVLELAQIAATTGVTRLAFGSVDFGVDSGISDEADAMTPVRTQIVLHSRAAQLPAPIDGVSVNFRNDEQMQRDAQRARQLGLGGKLCIHPAQVAAVNAAYQPTQDECAWAARVLTAFEASQGAATALDGKMIDKPVVERARRIIQEAAAAA